MKELKILMVDKDWNIAPILKSHLEDNNYNVILVTDGQKALKLFEEEKFDLCITDIDVPTIDGFLLAQKIRDISSKVPIVFLTARNEEADKIHAFESGADDYVTKPFLMTEVIYRVKAITRRCLDYIVEDNDMGLGDFTFNQQQQQLVYENPKTNEREVTKLTIKEATLLGLLVKNLGNVVMTQDILSRVWQNETYMHSRSMDVYITRLRRYLLKDQRIKIVNKHGVGYLLVVFNTLPVK